jgi:hypothetical protein
VASVGPNSGSQSGGTVVTIRGGGFSKATSVRFGAYTATSFNVTSDTLMTAVAPPGSGTVDVTVATPAGVSPTKAPNILAATDAAFENGPGSWFGNVNATAISSRNARTGSYSLESRPKKAGFQSVVSGAYPAAGRAVYTLHVWIETPGTSQHLRPFMIFYGSGGEILSIEQAQAYTKTSPLAWRRLSLSARSPQGAATVAVGIDDVEGGHVYIDDVSLTGSTRFTYR